MLIHASFLSQAIIATWRLLYAGTNHLFIIEKIPLTAGVFKKHMPFLKLISPIVSLVSFLSPVNPRTGPYNLCSINLATMDIDEQINLQQLSLTTPTCQTSRIRKVNCKVALCLIRVERAKPNFKLQSRNNDPLTPTSSPPAELTVHLNKLHLNSWPNNTQQNVSLPLEKKVHRLLWEDVKNGGQR